MGEGGRDASAGGEAKGFSVRAGKLWTVP